MNDLIGYALVVSSRSAKDACIFPNVARNVLAVPMDGPVFAFHYVIDLGIRSTYAVVRPETPVP
jgi:hypothetical protein